MHISREPCRTTLLLLLTTHLYQFQSPFYYLNYYKCSTFLVTLVDRIKVLHLKNVRDHGLYIFDLRRMIRIINYILQVLVGAYIHLKQTFINQTKHNRCRSILSLVIFVMSHNYTAANKAHFDRLAAQGYDEVPHALELARRCVDILRFANREQYQNLKTEQPPRCAKPIILTRTRLR